MSPLGARERARQEFWTRYCKPPQWGSSAPGRVNLIGDHTDYNGGFVLPIAIDRECITVGAPASDPESSRIFSTELKHEWRLDVRRILPTGERPSSSAFLPGSAESYIAGVIAMFQQRVEKPLFNVDVVISSDVSLGSGLSSSAALEISLATLLEQAVAAALDPLEKAQLCQRAEHEFAGVPCGLMDQLTAAMGKSGHALLIDCRSCAVDPIPMPAHTEATLMVINTNIRHALASGEYASRRDACESAAQKLGLPSLRDASLKMLDEGASELSETERRRSRHVVTENARTLAAAAALRAHDLSRFGMLMSESHISLRDDFEVSIPELNTVVQAAQACPGVYGARMTGGGFGGCAIALIRPEGVDAAAMTIRERFWAQHGSQCSVEVVVASAGAGPIAV